MGLSEKKGRRTTGYNYPQTRRSNKRQRKDICSGLDAITSSSDEDSPPSTSVEDIPLDDDIDDSDEWSTSSHEEF